MSHVRAHRITIVFAALALSVASTSLARADSGLLVVGGGAREHDRATIGGAIESTVRSAGWSLPAKPATKRETDILLNCEDANTPWTCVPSSITSKGIRNLFVVSIENRQAANGAPLVVITGRMIVTDPPEFAFGQRFCEHCADDRLIKAGAELTHALIDDLATRTGSTVIHFASEPSGADIILDGTKLGATEATYSTSPGKHTAMIQKAGYISQVREFTVDRGKTAELSFTLARSEALTADHAATTGPSRSPYTYVLPGLALGAGASLTVLGSVLVYHGLHDDAQYEYTRATAVGIPLGIVGLGAIGTGIYLLYRRDADSAPSASPAPGGVVVGWSGRF